MELATEDAEVNMRLFRKGGPRTDKGQSGTKTLMYGEAVPNGGGVFWGLDPTKPEFYGTAVARQIAKSIVANGLAERCKVHVAYFMGSKEPRVFIESSPDDDIRWLLAPQKIPSLFPLIPAEAIQEYGLRNPATISSIIDDGFIGNAELPWERIVSL